MILTPVLAKAAVSPIASSQLSGSFISRKDAKDIYLLKKRKWPDNALVMIYRFPLNSRAHQQFVREVLSITLEQYLFELKDIKRRGLESQIKEVLTQKEMLREISRSTNAVGCIDRDYMILNGGAEIKIIHLID